MSRKEMLAAALAHAAVGRPVFPCKHDGDDAKKPLTPHGYKDASRDTEIIRQGWSKHPRALIGMPTGAASGVFVLDVDQDEATGKDGESSLAALNAEHGPLPDTIEALTPRGGRHIWFRYPADGTKIANSASAIGPNLDIRGEGGYVILPPSELADGRCYAWEGSSDPDEGVRVADAPAWLLRLVAAPVRPPVQPPAPVPDVIPDGQRGETLYKLACSLRAKGLSPPAILAALQAENAARCRPPVDDARVKRIVASAAKKPAGRSAEYAARAARPPTPPPADTDSQAPPPSPERPTVVLRIGELSRVCDEAQGHLEQADCGIYRQGSRLVRIGCAGAPESDDEARRGRREPEAPTLHTMTAASLVDALSRHVAFLKFDRRSNQDVPADPPARLAELILSREGQWRFPPLIGHSECPCIAADGRLIAAPGYDAAAGLFILPHPVRPNEVPRVVTVEDARRALAELREWLKTFPFSSDADESAAIAAALTAVHRRPLPAAPLLAITASTPATGKSRLAECFAILATGRKAAFFTAGHTPEELEKRLDVILLTGDQAAVLDNLERPLRSDTLCSITTQASKSVRVLGLSRTVDCPTNTALILTGNNLTLLGDLQRRALLLRLEANCERPEERTFDRDALAYTRQRRAALLKAALLLPLAYHHAGRPDVRATPYGSFETWDAIIRRPLIWLGMADPLEPAGTLRDEDHELQGMRALYPAWWSLWGDSAVTPTEILDKAREATDPQMPVTTGPTAELAAALRDVLGDTKMTAQALGYRLRSWQGRILGAHRVTRTPRSAGGVRYQLARFDGV